MLGPAVRRARPAASRHSSLRPPCLPHALAAAISDVFLKFSTLSGWHLLDRRPRVLELCAGVPESNERFSTRKELFPFRFRFRAPSRPDTHPIDPPTMPPTRRNSDCGLQASKASKQTGKEANKQRSNEVSKQVQELNTSDANSRHVRGVFRLLIKACLSLRTYTFAIAVAMLPIGKRRSTALNVSRRKPWKSCIDGIWSTITPASR